MAMAAGYQPSQRSVSPRQQQQPSQINFGTFAQHVMTLLENGKSFFSAYRKTFTFSPTTKKRISKNMISEPKNFEHLIHTETEEEAEQIFKQWIKTPNAGKLPVPSKVSQLRFDLVRQEHSTTFATPPETLKGPACPMPLPNEGLGQGHPHQRDASYATFVVTENDELLENFNSGYYDEIEKSAIPSLSTVEQSSSTKIFFESYYHRLLTNPSGRSRRRLQLERELESMGVSEAEKTSKRQEWIANETEYMRLMREKISVNSFLILKTIGHGAFGVVKLVQEKDTGLYFAMKVMRKADMLKKGQEGHVRAERDLMTAASESAVWIVKLIYSFQDADHLYLVMEYMSGGDLLNLLIEKDIFEEDFAKFYVAEMVLCIEEAHKLGYIHRDIKPDNFLFNKEGHIKLSDFGLATDFHWAHDTAYYESQRRALLRKTGIDIENTDTLKTRKKPNNTKAALAWNLDDEDYTQSIGRPPPNQSILTWRDKNRKKMAFSVVGTNNYMAPEVLRGTGYDRGCDWWSLGVIMFEMLYGYPPFISKSRHTTRLKIINWRQTLRFPSKPRVSREVQDLIEKLICEKEFRLGRAPPANNGNKRWSTVSPHLIQQQQQLLNQTVNSQGLGDATEIKNHPWFRGVDWANLRNQEPPFKPALKDPADTRYFDEMVDDNPMAAPEGEERIIRDPLLGNKNEGRRLLDMRKKLAFAGYTFRGFHAPGGKKSKDADLLHGLKIHPNAWGMGATDSVRLRSMSL
ncbi:hypothetical protein BGZ76_001342 [Entomortierella beljakovae]|nr:hypothetical protein BGZ76_001342 [Entomortierella beljakovae]